VTSHGPQLEDAHLLIFLFQVLLLLGLARAFGELCRRFGQPRLVGEILVGVLLGPTILERAAPAAYAWLFPADPLQHVMLETVAWIGVLFLLLETGLEVDVSSAWRLRGPSLRIGIIGVVFPLALGFGLSLLLPARYLAPGANRTVFALFLGTTMAISAMVIIARVLRELELLKTDLGLITLCGYAVNDILAWVIFSLVLAAATSGALDWGSVIGLIVLAVAFTGACLTLGQRLTQRGLAFVARSLPGQPGALLTMVACIGLLCGAITSGMGLTPLLGFFFAGIMVGEASALTERLRNVLTEMVHSIFVPLYFASIALEIDFLENFDPFLVAFVTILSIAGKFAGAWLGSLRSGLSAQDQISVGIAFTPSGVTGIIVGTVALDAGISSLTVGPWLRWSIRRRGAVRVLDFLSRKAIVGELSGTSRNEAIRELCDRLADRQVDRQTLSAAVREREELMGTGLGHGVAMAHARLEGLDRPRLAFGRSSNGIDWDSPDGVPVQFAFLILTPVRDEGLQLQLFAAIAEGMSRAELREGILVARTEKELWSALRAAIVAPASGAPEVA
jgi:Kef-type K+ transport system membrane component KefB